MGESLVLNTAQQTTIERIGLVTTPRHAKRADKLIDALTDAGFGVERVVTRHGSQAHMAELLHDELLDPDLGLDIDAIAVAAGDGTGSKVALASPLRTALLPCGNANDISRALVRGSPIDLFRDGVSVPVRPLDCIIECPPLQSRERRSAIGYIGFGMTGYGSQYIDDHRHDNDPEYTDNPGFLVTQWRDTRILVATLLHAGKFAIQDVGATPYHSVRMRREILVGNGPNMSRHSDILPKQLWDDKNGPFVAEINASGSSGAIGAFVLGDLSGWGRQQLEPVEFQTATPVIGQFDGDPLHIGNGHIVRISRSEASVSLLTDQVAIPS